VPVKAFKAIFLYASVISYFSIFAPMNFSVAVASALRLSRVFQVVDAHSLQ